MFAVMPLLLLTGLCGQANSLDGDAAPEANKVQRERWAKFYFEQAAKYELRLDDNAEKQLSLVNQPVLNWSNPIRQGDTNGQVFVWTYQGRVEVVGTIFSYLLRDDRSKRKVMHSFHTLSLGPITAKLDDKQFWSPRNAGVDVKPIPGAAPPAETRVLRLAQMRSLSRHFSARIEGQEGGDRELRLVTRPLHRFDDESDAVLDGALFTFVMGTDPEVMLLIEARYTTDGFAWHYAAARFSHLPLRVQHNEKTVWTFTSDTRQGMSPYLSRSVVIRDALLP